MDSKIKAALNDLRPIQHIVERTCDSLMVDQSLFDALVHLLDAQGRLQKLTSDMQCVLNSKN